jgi:predicted NBD/HSP70 family sugar kinase
VNLDKFSRAKAKEYHFRLIFQEIYDHDPISRVEVARNTQLTPSAVSNLVGELIAQGLVAEVGLGSVGVGKPRTLLSIVKDARQVIGIDLGNEEFRGIVSNLRGEIIYQENLPLEGRRGAEAVEIVFHLVEHMIQASNRPLLGIGIGTPGVVDNKLRLVRIAGNLDWCNLPLGKLVQAKFKYPVLVENDSRAAVVGEHLFGNEKNLSNLVVIKVGYGISAGILINGQLYYGDNFTAGEIGHITIVPDGELCHCGHRGCLEAMASSRAIVSKAKQIANQNPNSIFNRIVNTPEAIDTSVVLRALQLGDDKTRELIQQVGGNIGIATANVAGLLGTKRIVIAGSVSRFGEVLVDAIREKVLERSENTLAKLIEIQRSPLGADIVTLGAATLIIRENLGPF